MKPRPKRKARAEAWTEQNELLDKLKFVRIRISEAHPVYGVQVKHWFAVDEGSAYQLHEAIGRCLEKFDRERERE